MDRTKLKQIILAVFVAVIFIASYTSFSNGGVNMGQTTTTSISPQTLYGVGTTNGIVSGYGTVMSVFVNCPKQDAVSFNVSSVLSKLTSNNSVYNYYSPNASTYTVYTGNLNSYELSNYISSQIGNASSQCLSFKGQTFVMLPHNMSFSINGQGTTLNLPQTLRNYSLVARIAALKSNIPVRVAGLFTVNGTLFGNLSVTYIGGN
ncbi:MAG: hypothetical protein KGH49_02395 [Candidatus Micrarchaeota archaeon]|nr:hypothetical protein [Candidatus Micrarchaeota archaeon]